jgi:transposase
MARKKGSKDYPLEMRREAVRLFYEEGLSRGEITQRLGIRDPNRVKSCLRRYRREGAEFFVCKRYRSGRKPKKENAKAYIARLEMENDLLKKFHTELRQAMLAKRNIGSSNITEESTK